MINQREAVIYADGGSRGNPGPAAAGVVFTDESGRVLKEYSHYLGEATNNQAEYRAVIAALDKIKDCEAEELNFFLDSELVVKQLNGEYRVKNQELAPLFVKIYNTTMKYKKVTFRHVRRELNKEADKLVNEAIDRAKASV